jgi:hypothetical protein
MIGEVIGALGFQGMNLKYLERERERECVCVCVWLAGCLLACLVFLCCFFSSVFL